MTFIVLFEDDPEADTDIRKSHMAAHLDFLETHQSKIHAAGPLSDDEHGGRDGLWIVEADTSAEIKALIRADPFWPTGLRKSYSILRWTQVFANGTRLIRPT